MIEQINPACPTCGQTRRPLLSNEVEAAMTKARTLRLAGYEQPWDESLLVRIMFYVNVDPVSGCWLWRASKGTHGYGRIDGPGSDGRRGAHQISYEYFHGPVPGGLELDHLCRVRHCVNPEHLEPVAHAVNVQRGARGDLRTPGTHCKHGHEFTPENTYMSRGRRCCRACGYRRKREYLARKRAAA